MIKNMAKAVALLFVLVALLCHLHTGDAQESCQPKSNISSMVVKTGNIVKGQVEYKVEFKTSCSCPIKDVHGWCDGVEDSAIPSDPSKVKVIEGMCVLKQPITKGSPLFFTYCSEVPVDFQVFSAPSCAN